MVDRAAKRAEEGLEFDKVKKELASVAREERDSSLLV